MAHHPTSTSCSNTKCQTQVQELLKVNELWKNDYGSLMHENNRLKAALLTKQQQQQQQGQTTRIQQQQQPLQQSHQFVQCSIEEIEALKQQVIFYKNECDREKEERLKAQTASKEFKTKLKESSEVTSQFQEQVERLQKKLKKQTDRRDKTANSRTEQQHEERKSNIELMQGRVFPQEACCTKHAGVDERDSASTNDNNNNNNNNRVYQQTKWTDYKHTNNLQRRKALIY